MPKRPGSIGREFGWDLGIATLSEYDDSGFLGVQVDVFGEEASGMPPFDLEHQFGFASRPRDPDKSPDNPTVSVGCQVLHAWDGDDVHAWLGSDPRYRPGSIAAGVLLPELSKGSSIQYNSAGMFSLLDVEDGWTEYIGMDPDADGIPTTAHVIAAGKDDTGKKHISFVHAEGHSFVLMEDGTVTIANRTGTVTVTVDDDNCIINGNTKIQGSLDVGLSAAVFLTKFPEMLAAFEALKAEVIAANTAIAAAVETALLQKTPAPGVPQTPGSVTAAAAAANAAISAVSMAPATTAFTKGT